MSMDIFTERKNRTQWFMDARFGMFIHWGLYAIPGRGEWVQSDERITQDTYTRYAAEWNPTAFDARAWARTSKEAGMRYTVLTTKHHEGFCLFDSAHTDFKSTAAPFGRDIVREFVDAFRAEGLKIGFYYSLLDWHHPDYPAYGDMYHPDRDNNAYQGRTHDFDRYLDFMHAQVRELMTNYGKIDILWFDFSYEATDRNPQCHFGEDWRGSELLAMVRKLQPGIVVNGRLEANGETYGTVMTDKPQPFAGDFACPEMIIPPNGLHTPAGCPVPWEACLTLNNNWGYAPADKHYKTAAHIIRKLVECVSKNGNLLVNVSPDAMGRIPFEQQRILSEVGCWMRQNGDSVYNCGAADMEKPEWGRYTCRDGTLYAHVLDPAIGALALPDLKGRIKRARRLSDGLEMLQCTPWVAKEFPGCVFINYGRPEYFHFDMGETPDTVFELTLAQEDE